MSIFDSVVVVIRPISKEQPPSALLLHNNSSNSEDEDSPQEKEQDDGLELDDESPSGQPEEEFPPFVVRIAVGEYTSELTLANSRATFTDLLTTAMLTAQVKTAEEESVVLTTHDMFFSVVDLARVPCTTATTLEFTPPQQEGTAPVRIMMEVSFGGVIPARVDRRPQVEEIKQWLEVFEGCKMNAVDSGGKVRNLVEHLGFTTREVPDALINRYLAKTGKLLFPDFVHLLSGIKPNADLSSGAAGDKKSEDAAALWVELGGNPDHSGTIPLTSFGNNENTLSGFLPKGGSIDFATLRALLRVPKKDQKTSRSELTRASSNLLTTRFNPPVEEVGTLEGGDELDDPALSVSFLPVSHFTLDLRKRKQLSPYYIDPECHLIPVKATKQIARSAHTSQERHRARLQRSQHHPSKKPLPECKPHPRNLPPVVASTTTTSTLTVLSPPSPPHPHPDLHRRSRHPVPSPLPLPTTPLCHRVHRQRNHVKSFLAASRLF
eukprot:NODE_229_length_1964_cov_226.628198_g180_i0.p1 GENE.NODE_229_length_1964_cov_226.628198_g180_i0~~NODE_229_length_1964_cov_226.628198_g180_i0.p1  ORF type:complete len:493 (+),score=124.37 NODE_229_length_1964_cov_226.628198_g180_i0:174-1652(+)